MDSLKQSEVEETVHINCARPVDLQINPDSKMFWEWVRSEQYSTHPILPKDAWLHTIICKYHRSFGTDSKHTN